MTPEEQAEAFGANLTGNPDTLHVFVVREADLADSLWPVVDSTLSQTPGPAGASTFAQTKRSSPSTCFERMGVALGILTILMMVCGAAALLWTGIASQPTAEVVLMPRSWQVSLTRTVPMETASPFPARVLAPVAISRSLTVATSGTGHTSAQVATGQITFYNGAFGRQTVAAGTPLQGRDGVVVVTEQAAIIPAALPTTPPTYGVTSVTAHALEAGSAGNIATDDIDTACCATSVLAENRSPFTGGQDARSFRVVRQADLDRGWQHLAPEVQQAIQTRLRSALHTGEELAPLSCHQQRAASAGVGQMASMVNVTLTMHCQTVTYQQAALQVFATNLLTKLAVQQAGMPIQMEGTARVSVLSVALAQSGKRTLTFAASALFIPAWTTRDLQRLAAALAGKTHAAAMHWLLSQPGVQQAIIRISGSDSMRSTLPENPANIHLVIELPSVLPTPNVEPSSSPSS